MMEFVWLTDPTAWLGLGTLVLLEVVLGIDNLVFIAILADKLPPHQRDRARIVGLSLALLMRLALLASISWMVTLTQPLFTVLGAEISGRDLIFISGGLFLLFKATKELHHRLEGEGSHTSGNQVYAGFNAVIAQIVVLDAVFSIDSVITAVGMANHLSIMMLAVVIAILVMMAASKPLTRFVNAHPTVIILCLGFLMMIGFSLIVDGIGFHIPKGYLYAAIGFSVLVEAFNQLQRAKRTREFRSLSLRERTAEAVLRLMGGNAESAPVSEEIRDIVADQAEAPLFAEEEVRIFERVMRLPEIRIGSAMTHRHEVVWIGVDEPRDSVLEKVRSSRHSRYLLCDGTIEQSLGIIAVKDILLAGGADLRPYVRQPIMLPETASVLDALMQFKQSATGFAQVVDEYGALQGVVTLKDVMEAIVGTLPEPEFREDYSGARQSDGSWLLDGGLAIHEAEEMLGIKGQESEGDFNTLAGLILHLLGHIPTTGETVSWHGFTLTVMAMDKNRIDQVRATAETND